MPKGFSKPQSLSMLLSQYVIGAEGYVCDRVEDKVDLDKLNNLQLACICTFQSMEPKPSNLRGMVSNAIYNMSGVFRVSFFGYINVLTRTQPQPQQP